MKVQAILFPKKKFTIKKAEKWLKDSNYIPIKKVHETLNFYRYRLLEPNKKFKYITKKLSNGVDLVIIVKKIVLTKKINRL